MTPGGLLSPTEVSADGTLRTPRVVGGRDADLLLLAVRDADSGRQLTPCPPPPARRSARRAKRVRDLSTVSGALVGQPCWPTAWRPRPRRTAGRPRRGRDRCPAHRPGRPHDHMSAAYAKDRTSSASRSEASRPSSTFGHARVALEFARPLPTAPPGRWPRHSPRSPTMRPWPRRWRRTPPTWRPGRPAGPRASGTRGSSTSTSS